MNYRNIFIISIFTTLLLFSPTNLRAQSYQEMDAELFAAEKRLWDEKLKPAYDTAWKEYSAGNYAKSVEEANKFLAYAPNAVGDLPVLRARALTPVNYGRNDLDSARARYDLTRTIENNPKDAWNYMYLGDLFLTQYKVFEANIQYNKALEIDPNSYWAVYGIAKSAFYARDYQGCVNAINKFTAHAEYKKQTDAWAYSRLGECYASLGDMTNAKQSFERAVAVQPGLKYSWAYLALSKDGYTCKKLGRDLPDKRFDEFVAWRRASFCPNSAINFPYYFAEDPNLAEFVNFYNAESYRLSNKVESADTLAYEDAKAFLKEARRLADEPKRTGKPLDEKTFNKTLELLNHAINIKSRNEQVLDEDVDVVARVMRAKLLLSHSDKQIQILAWREQMELSVIPKAELQMTYKESGLSKKPLYKNGADVNASLLRGIIYAQVKQNHRAALAEFDAAIKTLETVYVRTHFDVDAPIFAEPYRRKGDMLTQLGDTPGAVAAYNKAIAINPSDTEAKKGFETLSQMALSKGNTAEADAIREIRQTNQLNDILGKIFIAEQKFSATKSQINNMSDTGSKARASCEAIRNLLGVLHQVRGNLVMFSSSLQYGSKLWKITQSHIDATDSKIKQVNGPSGNCSDSGLYK